MLFPSIPCSFFSFHLCVHPPPPPPHPSSCPPVSALTQPASQPASLAGELTFLSTDYMSHDAPGMRCRNELNSICPFCPPTPGVWSRGRQAGMGTRTSGWKAMHTSLSRITEEHMPRSSCWGEGEGDCVQGDDQNKGTRAAGPLSLSSWAFKQRPGESPPPVGVRQR